MAESRGYTVRLSRLSAAGIYASLAYVVLGVALAPINPRVHESLMALTIGLLFPVSISLSAFIGPLKGGRPRSGYEAVTATVLTLAAVAAPALAVADQELGLGAAAVSLALAAVYSVESSLAGRRREPKILFYYPPLAGALTVSYLLFAGEGFLRSALGLALSYPVALIYSFSALTMTRNYSVRVTRGRVLPPLLIHSASIALYLLGLGMEALFLASLFMLLHFIVMGYHRFPGLVEKAFSMKSPVNRRAYLYIVAGHTAALAATVYLAAYLASGALENRLDLLITVHLVYMGFIGLHIYLHAPLMAPSIVETGSARRYNPLPVALLLAAVLARPVAPSLTYVLVAASLAGLLLVVKPSRPLRA
jgi:hypothetical protein